MKREKVMRTYNKREVQQILKRNGWVPDHQTGSHVIYKNASGEHLVISMSKCNKMITQRLIKQYKLVV